VIRRGTVSTVRTFAALSLVLALGVLVLANVASAHKQRWDTDLQLRVDRLTATTTQYSGSVRSERAKCERNRVITITTGGVAIGTATSDFEGNYTVVVTGTPPAKNQDVIASTPKTFLKRNSKHKHKCRPATVTRKATGQPV
jgi:hypothetical protein